MAKDLSLKSIIYTFLLVILTILISARADEERKVYIVYMGALPRNQLYTPSTHHVSLLQKITGQSFPEKLIIRTYKRSFNGFAAKLTRNEAKELSSAEGVVSVFPERNYKLSTTRSWDFLGFNETTSQSLQRESNIIIGVIDSGIWPELASFSDEGFGRPPRKWKGACAGGKDFICNNKVIGARYYGPLDSARDHEGHGTYTASVAAGVPVNDISFYGLAQGTVRGGAPSARIAVYRVCFHLGCSNVDLLNAFDDAIADGVNIISVSINANRPSPFNEDAVAIGAFHAMARGVLTSNSAGNTGNTIGITSNAPWMISVAASSTDRRIVDKVVLGNGMTFVGNSIQIFDLDGTMYPLADYHDEPNFKGKIMADRITTSLYAASAGAVGAIYKSARSDIPKVEPVPAASISSSDLDVVSSYINSSSTPVATILKSEEIKDHSAPVVASFSARGPNPILQEIMKPDVTAPGIGILAGYSPIAPITSYSKDSRRVEYHMMSGTSMACPHVTGIAAYIKSFHPGWSPSAIQSAIMTTAIPLDKTTNPDGELAFGSGQINPLQAIDPGLVYEATKEDYIKLLCRNGFDNEKLRGMTGDRSSCPRGVDRDPIFDFNYPSLIAKVNPDTFFTVKYQRTVTNVGPAKSTYYSRVLTSLEPKVIVEPEVLSFRHLYEKISFNVTTYGQGFPANSFKSTTLEWSDGIHKVRIPVIVHTMTPKLQEDVKS